MLFILLTAVFVVINVVPGDPLRAIYGSKVSEDFIQKMREQLGLNKPLHLQYVDYWVRILQGNLGTSIFSLRPVTVEISYAFPVTLELTTLGMLLSTVVGLPLGVLCALRKYKLSDFLIRLLSLAGYSLPIFILGQILQYVFAGQFSLFPVQGRCSPKIDLTYITHFGVLDSLITGNFAAALDCLSHLFLPCVSLAVSGATVIARISRANMIETLDEDYILMARAKGLRERTVIYKHALRSAILPVFTIIGLWFAFLLGGAVIIETVFSLPGMGKLLLESINRRDYPVIQGCVIVYAVSVVVVTTIVDILYAFLDPRIRY
jgi:peptide/nickel transport system permease protein